MSAHLDNMVGARRLWIAGGEFGRTRQARGLVSALGGERRRWSLGARSQYLVRLSRRRLPHRGARLPQTPVTDRRATFHGLLRLDHLFFRLDEGWRGGFRRAERPLRLRSLSPHRSDHIPVSPGPGAGRPDRRRSPRLNRSSNGYPLAHRGSRLSSLHLARGLGEEPRASYGLSRAVAAAAYAAATQPADGAVATLQPAVARITEGRDTLDYVYAETLLATPRLEQPAASTEPGARTRH